MAEKQFNKRPRFQSQSISISSEHGEREVDNFLALAEWNGLTVSVFRRKGNPRMAKVSPQFQNVTEDKHNFDISTLVIPIGFCNVTYKAYEEGNKVKISELSSDVGLEEQFSCTILLNVENEERDRSWLRSTAINPCLDLQGIDHQQRGDERCAIPITYEDTGIDLFPLFEHTGQVEVNQWTRNSPARRRAIGLIEDLVNDPAKNKKSYFMPLLLSDNSICYYFIPEANLESELELWHNALKKAESNGKRIMIAINGPIYHKDDWGICFTEVAEPVIDN
ncbi:hypothetical protein [Flavilitoribacter nigricans]|uniref:Uncharacterized protein n=1 Tax=Flavilitoribacter nigricans (strain ATCC 23147 / DSM 23189 / NBRC 102662 / NCIMB 1420 / SS-2) TaxID=1122177 RepID=A0A2D0MXG9_FLAN2|nr:hypothetical protein [Flavilitoribacter nigricans]PHN00935.1 hypothetical protein CRP01_39765 [Flavilitoribacter nigricans DSM 23189 = NBRC 102662]